MGEFSVCAHMHAHWCSGCCCHGAHHAVPHASLCIVLEQQRCTHTCKQQCDGSGGRNAAHAHTRTPSSSRARRSRQDQDREEGLPGECTPHWACCCCRGGVGCVVCVCRAIVQHTSSPVPPTHTSPPLPHAGYHREVLQPADPGFRHQQAPVRGGRRHPVQAPAQQDCRVLHGERECGRVTRVRGEAVAVALRGSHRGGGVELRTAAWT